MNDGCGGGGGVDDDDMSEGIKSKTRTLLRNNFECFAGNVGAKKKKRNSSSTITSNLLQYRQQQQK